MRVSTRGALTGMGLAALLAVASAPARASVDGLVAAGPAGTAQFAWGQQGRFGVQVHERRLSATAALGDAQMVSPAFRASKEQWIGSDAAGNAVIAWIGADAASDSALYARRRLVDGALTAAQRITPAGVAATTPRLAVEPDGDAVLVWVRVLSGKTVVQARRYSANGSLGAIETLSYAGANASMPDVAVAPSGAATVAWLRSTADSEVYGQTRTLGGDGSLSAAQSLTAASANMAGLNVTVDDAGTAVIAWTRSGDGGKAVESRARTAAGVLKPAQSISGPGASGLATAGNGAGRTAYVWVEVAFPVVTLKGRVRQPNGTLGQPFDLQNGLSSAPRVAMDPAGHLTFAWQVQGPEHSSIEGRRRTVGGVLGPVRAISDPAGDATLPHVVVDADGKATVAWISGPEANVLARTLTAGGAMSPVLPISVDK